MSEREPASDETQGKKIDEQDEEGGNLDKITAELENLPPEVKRVVQATLSMQRISTPFGSPLQDKINEGHISKILDIVEKDDERTFADAQAARKYTLINTVIILIFFGLLTVFLVNKDVEVYRELLKLTVAFAGGLGSGFGLKGYLDKKSK